MGASLFDNEESHVRWEQSIKDHIVVHIPDSRFGILGILHMVVCAKVDSFVEVHISIPRWLRRQFFGLLKFYPKGIRY